MQNWPGTFAGCILVLIGFLEAGCTKNKLGKYILSIDGMYYSRTGKTYCCDTTKTYTLKEYHSKSQVDISFVGNTTIEIAGNIWEKDGDLVKFDSIYSSSDDPRPARGGGYRDSVRFTGHIVSDELIEGDYYLDGFSWVISSAVTSTTIHGKFKIEKN